MATQEPLYWIKPKGFFPIVSYFQPQLAADAEGSLEQIQSQPSHSLGFFFPSYSYQSLRDILCQNLHWSNLIAADGATHQGKIISGTMACFEFLTVPFSRLRIETQYLCTFI